ncbi:DUF484 family protein [Pseudomaricurvus alkylphenolicus]|jgi:uncharacterized protein YigA (DUF484 family)|uniref:DUF484 family protein n=1 Tax=Pseudomaricurvus alkylphenolicus TaxID=1306991 RepID=UPI0014225674|nr:DUF484 family protein [Pseudomaricurvus alkylphenolicus]NIB39413.1 DUF484 family protein [Pseudomaricurvus alkylphenolicus]
MSDQTLIDTESAITEEQVVEYLRQHPDFFVKQPGLLADLRLPHESGQAISLVERQVSILRERNMDMRHRLSKLLDNARDNDRLFDKTKRLVLALLQGKTLEDTVDALMYSFGNDFKIHYTTLLIYGDPARLPNSAARVEPLSKAREHIAQILKSNKPLCGSFNAAEVAYLFPDHSSAVGSMALVPLIHGNSFGLLAIANRDPHYYASSMGTLFLSYIGEVLNRILPPHLES